MLVALLAYLSAFLAMGLAVAAIVRNARLASHLVFGVGMVALAVESLLCGQSMQAVSVSDLLRLQTWRLVVMAFLPGTWLLFGLTYSRGNYREFVSRWWLAVAAALVLPIGLALGFSSQLVVPARTTVEPETVVLALGFPGLAVHLSLLVGAVLVLMNLERTFRASVGTMRWRIKFVMLGLAVLFMVRIYTSSQVLLYRAVDLRFQVVNVCALLIACVLIAVSLMRTGLFAVDLYPSHAVLRHSLTVVLVGIYLLIVGVLAKLVTWMGGTAAFPLKAFLVLVALVVLTLLLLSDRFRQYTQRFVSRHLRRPSYDYRQVWQTFTERVGSQMTWTDLSRAVTQWVSETFNVLSATVWLVGETRKRLVFGASTAVDGAVQGELVQSDAEFAALATAMAQRPHPLDLEDSEESWAKSLRQTNPSHFKEKGGDRFAVPLVMGEEFLGLLTLGDRVSGVPFSVEDLELLKCIGDQVAGSLLSIRLSQRLIQAKEMEAFQTMSAFFVHDLKNTASTLSLMLQNLPKHFDNPEFRQDALRSLGRCVSHINDLIGQLTLLRKGLDLNRRTADLNAVVASALTVLESNASTRLVKDLQPSPAVSLDVEQMQKVVTNLVLNALDAVSPGGEVRIQTGQRDGWAMVTVADNGCGMSPEFVQRQLFRPFQTTKKKGMGIGLFHTRMIVEAHGGKIEVESELGKGTTFRVLLPS